MYEKMRKLSINMCKKIIIIVIIEIIVWEIFLLAFLFCNEKKKKIVVENFPTGSIRVQFYVKKWRKEAVNEKEYEEKDVE